MGCGHRPIETNSNELTADVYVRFDDIHFPNYDDWHDVNETIVGHHHDSRYIQNIRAVRNGNNWPEACLRFGAHCMRWIGFVQVSQYGIVAVARFGLVGIC